MLIIKRKHFIYLSIFWIGVVLLLSLFNFQSIDTPSTLKFPHIDKLAHLTMYSILSFLLLAGYSSRKNRDLSNSRGNHKYINIIVFILSSIFGIIVEALQYSLTDYRSGDYLDAIANTIGVIVGIITYSIAIKCYTKYTSK